MKPAQVHNALGMVIDLYGSMLTELVAENAQLKERLVKAERDVRDYEQLLKPEQKEATP